MKCLDTSILMLMSAGMLSEGFGSQFVINDLTLAEFCSILLKRFNRKTADYWFKKLQAYSYPVSREMLYEAVTFRWEKGGKMSFFDAVAYVFARNNNCQLVTADSDFRNLPGVELVKKY